MNIAIDIGNTYIKTGVFNNGKLIFKFKTVANQFISKFNHHIKPNYTIDHLIYSSSGKVDKALLDFFNSQPHLVSLTHQTKLPFINAYDTPETLGLDRIALVAAAQKIYNSKNTLVIDAGTCVTYDFLSNKNIYYGGSISPGLDMRFRALNDYTANLPRLLADKINNNPVGKNTKEAILKGVINGLIYEIDQNIERYRADYKELTVILTGGDQVYLSTKLKNSIFANSNFQLEGLNAILEFHLND